MEATSLKRLSLDTNVLFDLADKKDFAHDSREICQQKACALFISPTVAASEQFGWGQRISDALGKNARRTIQPGNTIILVWFFWQAT